MRLLKVSVYASRPHTINESKLALHESMLRLTCFTIAGMCTERGAPFIADYLQDMTAVTSE